MSKPKNRSKYRWIWIAVSAIVLLRATRLAGDHLLHHAIDENNLPLARRLLSFGVGPTDELETVPWIVQLLDDNRLEAARLISEYDPNLGDYNDVNLRRQYPEWNEEKRAIFRRAKQFQSFPKGWPNENDRARI